MDNFDLLLQRYLDHTATEEEKSMLFSMIQSGKFDEVLEDKILNDLHGEILESVSDDEQRLMDKLYADKLRGLIAEEAEPRKRSLWVRWPAAAAALAGLMIGFWWIAGLNRRELPAPMAHQETKASIDDQLIKFSDRQVVRLPDGSTVLLNKGSELSYNPDQFGTKNRQVNLTGEGFFDISHDPSRPFLVHTGKITTTVLGTAFNINSFLHKNEIRVTVTRGKVQVGDAKTTYAMITPDQEIIVNTATNAFVKQTVKTEVVTEWKDKFLIMDNVTMSEAVDLIAGRFNVKLVFANEDLKKCRVSASFLNDEDLDHVLKVIGAVNQITFTNKPNGEIALSGESSCQ